MKLVSSMIASLRRGVAFLWLILTLGIPCLALEGDDQIRISFSIWSPPSMDLDLVDGIVTDALRSFLCQDAKLILLDTQFRRVCYLQAEGEENTLFSNIQLSMLDLIKQTDPFHSYLADEASNVLISELNEINDSIQGTTWDVNYEVLQVGMLEIESARIANFTDEMAFMEHRIQQHLNMSIAAGIMNQRFEGTEIIMGKLGQEIGIVPGSSLTLEEEHIYANNPELNFKESALILRYIGTGMLVGCSILIASLTSLGRKYRLEQERKEMEALDPEYHRGLVTEQGVNLMLERGRRESELMAPSNHASA